MDKPLRVLDSACGSGSFLLGAYQCLLDWYIEYYRNHDRKSWARRPNPPIYQADGGDYRLTVAERKRILTEHIFGVDIDPQAVEVSKLSLLLKVLEGETAHTLAAHLWYEKERALPDHALIAQTVSRRKDPARPRCLPATDRRRRQTDRPAGL